MPADLQEAKRQQQYDSLILERDVPALLGGLTVEQHLLSLASTHTSPETESTAPQPLLLGLQ